MPIVEFDQVSRIYRSGEHELRALDHRAACHPVEGAGRELKPGHAQRHGAGAGLSEAEDQIVLLVCGGHGKSISFLVVGG